jgi:hypothetical protein
MKILLFLYVLITIGFASAALEKVMEEKPGSEIYEYEGAGAIEAYKDLSYLLETNFSVEIDQSVQGNGFYSSYKYTSVPDPYGNFYGLVGYGISGMVAQDHSHGSGTMDKQYKLSGYTFYTEAGVVPGEGEEPVIDDDEVYSLPFINVKEDSDMKYNPSTMSVGTGHYRENPIKFNSLLKESTCIKNLDTGGLMQNDIDYASAIEKELEASADWLDLANTIMNLEETVTDGRVHIGVLKLIDVPNFREEVEEENPLMPFVFKRSIPEIEVDEIYQGTFQIKKNMSLSYFDYESDFDEDGIENWIPCCIGGWDTMPQLYQVAVGKDDKGVFDCTCYKTPIVAQFPRVY